MSHSGNLYPHDQRPLSREERERARELERVLSKETPAPAPEPAAGPATEPGVVGPLATLFQEILTPRTAQQWLDDYTFNRQRPVSEPHVKGLVEEINRGMFYPGVLHLADCQETGKTYLLDGQHRLRATIGSGRSVRFNVAHYEHESMQEVLRHYAAIDRGRIREGRHMPETQELAEKEGLNSWQSAQTYAAVAQLLTGFQSPGKEWVHNVRSVSLRIEILEQVMTAAARYWRAVSCQGRTERHLRAAGCHAVGIITFREQPDKARDFWNRIADPEGLTAGTGPYLLIHFFLSGRQERLLAHELARYVARCWSMFYEGATRQVLTGLDATKPIWIAGTRYDGRQHYPWFGGEAAEVPAGRAPHFRRPPTGGNTKKASATEEPEET